MTAAEPVFAIMVTRSDEAGERLAYTGLAGAAAQQTSAVWQVLAARFVFTFGSVHASYTLELVTPPIPVLNTDAEPRWFALRHHPSAQLVVQLRAALFSVTDFAADVNEFGADGSNLRLHAHKVDTVDDKVLAEQLLRHNHQNKLVEIIMLKLIGYHLLMSLYSMSLFLRLGGYFPRLVAATKEVVHGHRDIRPWPPHQLEQRASEAFAAELIDLLLVNNTPPDP